MNVQYKKSFLKNSVSLTVHSDAGFVLVYTDTDFGSSPNCLKKGSRFQVLALTIEQILNLYVKNAYF